LAPFKVVDNTREHFSQAKLPHFTPHVDRDGDTPLCQTKMLLRQLMPPLRNDDRLTPVFTEYHFFGCLTPLQAYADLNNTSYFNQQKE
jgi:hypothetical protein